MIFTLLLWSFMLLIYFSAKNSKTNRWCVISIFVFSLGTLKEYLYYDLVPILVNHFGYAINMQKMEYIYSVMTAILYFLVMPCCVIFSLYFSGYQDINSKRLRHIKYFIFSLSILLNFIYFPYKISFYQHNSRTFWYVLSVYNIFYGTMMTFIMLKTAFRVKSPLIRRQKKLISVIILPPIWYWLITIFVIHSLGIISLYKVWEDNAVILFASILLYIVTAFTEGIMGLKLQYNNYHWDSDMKVAGKGAFYTSHILKNEITKIDWCLNNLSTHFNEEKPAELDIIHRSVNHLKQFVDKTQLYANEIILKKENASLAEIIDNAVNSAKKNMGNGIKIEVDYSERDYLSCDPAHMTEVLNNLISNAAEAMNNEGKISILVKKNKNMQLIIISDEGEGIPRKYKKQVFNPYFTTKKTSSHFGLGLSYCYNVMKKHKGYIDLNSEEGKGSSFYLYLPMQ
jgi:signal transduction histidine kinase